MEFFLEFINDLRANTFPTHTENTLKSSNLLVCPDAQQCPQPAVSQAQQPTVDRPLPGETKDDTVACAHVRTGSGNDRGVDQVKVETAGPGAGRQAGGPPSQGYSKYQKSLPPRFQRQQQVQVYMSVGSCLNVFDDKVAPECDDDCFQHSV